MRYIWKADGPTFGVKWYYLLFNCFDKIVLPRQFSITKKEYNSAYSFRVSQYLMVKHRQGGKNT